ncbi:MAG: cytochrome c oxidase subunit 3 [Streptosporangiaceae bacterium]
MSASTVSAAHPAEHTHDVGRTQQVGVILLILGDVAFFLSLVFTYFYLRGLNTDGNWVPRGSATIGPASGWIVAGIMVLAAVAYWWGEQGIRAGDTRRLNLGVTLAMILVLADFAVQADRLATLPFTTQTGSYASTVITMFGSHLVHLLITLFLGIAIWNRNRRGMFSAERNWHVRVTGYWFYWVALSAVLLALTTSFVTSPHAVP